MVLNETGPRTTFFTTPRSPVLTGERWDKALLRLKHFYLAPFRAIAAAFRVFSRNRDRVRRFVRQPKVASVIKYGMLVTMLLWLAIALLNRDEDDSRLNDALRGLWSKSAGDEQMPNRPVD
jgi:hypothetical protein